MADPGLIASARQLVHATGIDLADATHMLADLYADAYATGVQSATGMLGQTPDWTEWEPGYGRAALEAWGDDGGRGLRGMLDQAGVTIRSVAENRMDDLAEVLGQSLDEGWGVDRLADELQGVLDDPSRAEMVARTESARAMTTASLDEYKDAGVTGQAWLLSDGACPLCEENEAASPIGIDEDWPNGDVPVHPDCVCAIAPEYLDSGESTSEPDTADTMAE